MKYATVAFLLLLAIFRWPLAVAPAAAHLSELHAANIRLTAIQIDLANPGVERRPEFSSALTQKKPPCRRCPREGANKSCVPAACTTVWVDSTANSLSPPTRRSEALPLPQPLSGPQINVPPEPPPPKP